MGQLFVLFLCNFCRVFRYVEWILVTKLFSLSLTDLFSFPAKYNTQGAFLIIFLICSNLLKCLRSFGIIVIGTESVLMSLKQSFSSSNSSRKLLFYTVLIYSLNSHHRYFNFNQKYQQYGLCFKAIFPFLMTTVGLILNNFLYFRQFKNMEMIRYKYIHTLIYIYYYGYHGSYN